MSNMSSICDKTTLGKSDDFSATGSRVKGSDTEDECGEFAFRHGFLQIRASREEIP